MSRQTGLLLSFVIASALMLSACQLPGPQSKVNVDTTTSTPVVAPTASATSEAKVAPGNKQVALVQTYQSPAELEKVGFMIVVDSNGVITDTKVDVLATNKTSLMYQQNFAQKLPELLKGKKLAELSQIDRVGGSSLTTGAFNKALSELKAKL